MEELDNQNTVQCCNGCLSGSDESLLQNYKVQNNTLKTLFRAETLSLCYICKRMAQHADLFIQNVQSNQILLENFHNLMDATFQTVRDQIQPLIELKHFPLDIIQLSGNPTDDNEPSFVTYNCNQSKEVTVKLEMKEEDGDIPDHLEGEFVDDEEFQNSLIKEEEEDEYPLKRLLKQEFDNNNLNHLKKSLKKKKVKKKDKKKSDDGQKERKDIPKVRHLFITREQCMEERKKMIEDNKYLNCVYKCENCIKGFNFKASYEKHMEKHSETLGDYECDICKQRFPSEEKLQSHRRYHQLRYKCSECGLTRVSRLTIKEHYTATHCAGYFQYNCPHCPKVFTRQVSLRKHICYAHTHKARVSCAYCHKTYANKECLKAHMIRRHPKDEAVSPISKRYVCSECGMGFSAPSQLRNHSVKHSRTRDYYCVECDKSLTKISNIDEAIGTIWKRYVCSECGMGLSAPSQLRNHSVKHSRTRDYYCVECDKSFKSDAVLQNHLKTASPHVNYLELPLPCLHCTKRFAIRRDLERHTNRVHLNIRPYQCDMCDKAYVNGWSLREHKKLVHEGYKRPLKYPCTMCDKVFDRNQILKSHIRTHTGERPYQCSKCPAQFSQPGVLRTHDKLIHLKLARNGRPKASVVKTD